MRYLIRRYGSLATAMMIGLLLVATPAAVSAAYDAVNSDKVDGKHAVSAATSIENRVGKLVATNSTGRLPNNIIAKAPDANRLDGRDSSAFLSGYERVLVQSAFDAEKSKSLQISCPAGKKVIGGGFHMSFSTGTARWDNVNVWNNHPLTDTEWIVSAYTLEEGTWQLNGYAICVRTG